MRRLRIAFALLALGVTLVTSVPARAQEAPSSTQPMRPNRPLLITGGSIIAASYTPAVIVAATSDHPGDKSLYVPVAGPWMDLAQRGGCGANSCGTEAVYKSLLVLTGVAHAVGVGAVVASLFVPEQRGTTTTSASTKLTLTPAQIGRTGYGLSLAGGF